MIIGGVVVASLLHLGDFLALLAVALGLSVGWGVGIVLAPYQSEQERFKDYLKLLSAFATGYAVSKTDRLFELWFDPVTGPLVLQAIVAARLMLFIISFLLAAITTYVARSMSASDLGRKPVTDISRIDSSQRWTPRSLRSPR